MREEIEETEIVVNKFNEESVKDFRKKVHKLSSMDPNMPIVITIDSYGGYVDSFNTMLSIMRSVPNTFVTVCQGKAMSAGAALLSLGDIRFCDPSARIMIHEASGGAVGHADDVKTDAKEFDRLNMELMTLIANRCGKTYEELKSMIIANMGRDLYLTAQQAKHIGLIDFVGLPMIKASVEYSVQCIPPKAKVKIQDKTTQVKKEVKTKTDTKKKTIKKKKK